jgi:uncharacterized repeat protein (TIGR01451 family)
MHRADLEVGPYEHPGGVAMRKLTIRICGTASIVIVVTVSGFAQSSTGVLELVSVSSAEGQGDNASGSGGFVNPSSSRAAVTPDGRFVAFVSSAENLVPGDTNLSVDVFVRDRLTGTTERVSVTSRGREGNGHSGITSETVDISDDGRFVVFDSEATNLAKGDDNANAEVFVHDRLTGETVLISRGVDGNPATGDSPAISGNGRFVAFISSGQTLVAGHPEFNLFRHAYVFDRETQAMERVDVDATGELTNGVSTHVDISRDGRFVAFDSFADNLVAGPGDQGGVDVFVRDRQTGTTEGASTSGDTGTFEGECFLSSISANGRFVGFTADGSFGIDSNAFASDAVVFDRQLIAITIVSRNSAGEQANDDSETPFVSDDGNTVVFSSRGSNLVANDTNEVYDVFRRVNGVTERIAADDDEFAFPAIGSGMTPDGSVATLITGADLGGDTNFAFDVYAFDARTAADLRLANDDSPDPVTARATLTYTVRVQNLGPGAATGVTVTDPLPADASFVSAAATQGTCTRAGGGKSNGVLTCTLGTINAFDSVTITIVVSPSRAGTLTNTATVSASSSDPDAANNSATATTTVVAR